MVHAVTDFGSWVGDVFRPKTLIDGLPRGTGVIRAERACGGDSDEDSLGILGIQNDGVQAQSAGPGLPARSCTVPAHSGELLPALGAIGRAEQRGVFDSGVHRVRVGERGFEMPDSLEL